MVMRIFVNGSFDLLHTGHLNLLYYAKSLGSLLHVAIDSDTRIKTLKGYDRPINTLTTRLAILQAIKPVDSVEFFSSDSDLIEIIKMYKPDIMVKGSDWRGKHIIGQEYCKEVVFYERTNNESTTKTLQDFIARRQLL
jgi:D-beta-D-heptose 7-phosphate kinase/D-beta-D-heptose 1-phosphate adenosyltransferase